MSREPQEAPGVGWGGPGEGAGSALAVGGSSADSLRLVLIASAHLFVDLCQGMVVAMLPFLVSAGRISYAAGGGLVFAASASSSVVQPIFGHLADRLTSRWLLPLSLVVTGWALAGAAQVNAYAGMIGLLAISGLGVAAFHPEGARQARRTAGARISFAMSIFAVGGGIGFALGPIVTAALVTHFGTDGMTGFLLPTTLLIASLIYWQFPASPRPRLSPATRENTSPKERWGAFAFLSLLVIARSVAYVGCNTFLALYWMQNHGASAGESTTVLGVFLGTGIVGTLIGGFVADRLGHRAIIRLGFGLSALLLPLVLVASRGWAVAWLVPFAMALSFPWGVMMALGQEYLPGRVGMASGVTLGLSVSVGGIFAPVLGWYADGHGTASVMVVIEGVLAAVAVLAFFLPAPRHE